MLIKRFYDDGFTTLGVLTCEKLSYPLFTVERPWKNNKKRESCIPAGTYHVTPHVSPTKEKCFAINSVEGREKILIHSANFSSELLGCVGVGMSCGNINTKPAVLDSKKAMDLLLKLYTEPFELEII